MAATSELTVSYGMWNYLFIGGLWKELEAALVEYNLLEALSLEVHAYDFEIKDFIGLVEMVLLVKTGWSALRQVSFKFQISYMAWGGTKGEEHCKVVQAATISTR